MTTINNNYELWLVRYADGDLNADEREAVEMWLATHPEAAEELRLYSEAPRLQRDESVRYGAVLRHHTLPLWTSGWRWAAAAAVLLLLLSPVALHLFRGTEQPVQVAQTMPTKVASAVADSGVEASTAGNDEIVAPTFEQAPVKAITTRQQASEPLIAIADEDAASIENSSDAEKIEMPEIPHEEHMSNPIFVDNLIVFEEEPEPVVEYVTVNEVTYTNTESSINPIGHFISTFIKANK